MMFRGSVLACATLFCLPTLWQVLVTQNVTLETAMIRFLVAVPVSALLLALVRAAMRHRPDPPAESDSGGAAGSP